MSDRATVMGAIRGTLYNNAAVTAAITAQAQTPIIGIVPARVLMLEAQFTYGSGGTSADVYVQTSLDGGLTWFDIANFHFTTSSANKLSAVVGEPATPFTAGTTPGSGALTANTVLNGIIGDRIRALVTTVGTYAATALRVDMVSKY